MGSGGHRPRGRGGAGGDDGNGWGRRHGPGGGPDGHAGTARAGAAQSRAAAVVEGGGRATGASDGSRGGGLAVDGWLWRWTVAKINGVATGLATGAAVMVAGATGSTRWRCSAAVWRQWGHRVGGCGQSGVGAGWRGGLMGGGCDGGGARLARRCSAGVAATGGRGRVRRSLAAAGAADPQPANRHTRVSM